MEDYNYLSSLPNILQVPPLGKFSHSAHARSTTCALSLSPISSHLIPPPLECLKKICSYSKSSVMEKSNIPSHCPPPLSLFPSFSPSLPLFRFSFPFLSLSLSLSPSNFIPPLLECLKKFVHLGHIASRV